MKSMNTQMDILLDVRIGYGINKTLIGENPPNILFEMLIKSL